MPRPSMPCITLTRFMQHSHSHSMAEPVGCEPTPEEASQNVEQQKIELETLQSIYSEEINVLQDDTEYLVSFITAVPSYHYCIF